MRYLLCLLAFALSLSAGTGTGTVTVPDAQDAQFATIIESYVQGQVKPDGTPKYPGGTQAARRQSLLNVLLRNALRVMIWRACSQFPADCPLDIKAERSAEATAKTNGKAALEALIQ